MLTGERELTTLNKGANKKLLPIRGYILLAGLPSVGEDAP